MVSLFPSLNQFVKRTVQQYSVKFSTSRRDGDTSCTIDDSTSNSTCFFSVFMSLKTWGIKAREGIGKKRRKERRQELHTSIPMGIHHSNALHEQSFCPEMKSFLTHMIKGPSLSS